MIDLGRPPLHGDDITIFADHADPARFHYLPDRPRLRFRPDGLPEVALLKYRLDPDLNKALGAGLLSLTVDLGVEEERLGRLRARLTRQFGLSGVQLAPALADSGTCELLLMDKSSDAGPGSSDLVERVLGAAAPALYGDNAATFMVVLSPEGAALAEGALRGGGLPAGVVYRLQCLGLRPALRAQIRADWEQAYHYYENRLHGGQLLLAVDVGKTVEELVQAQAIQIQIDELVPDAEHASVYEQVLGRVQDYVLQQLFKPTLGEKPPAPPDPEGGALGTIGGVIKGLLGAFTITYSLRHIDRTELKTLTYQLAAARAERITLSPQGSLALLLRDAEGRPLPVDKLITEVEPAASPEMRFDVGAAVDLAAEEIDHLEVFLRYGDRMEALVLDPATPRRPITFWYRPELGLKVYYRFAVHLRAAGPDGKTALESAEQATEDRVLRIDPRDLYQRLVVQAVAQGVPFARFPLVLCDLRADAPNFSAAETLKLSVQAPEGQWVLHAGKDVELRFQQRLRYIDAAGTETRFEWQDAERGILVVGDPFPDVLDVQVLGSARFGTEVARLIVELRPKGDPARVASRVLTAAQPFATWSCPLSDPRQRSYEYRVTVHTIRGEVRAGSWLPGEGGKLVVGEGFSQLREVQLLFVGRSLPDLKLLGIKVRFSFEDREANLSAEDEVLVQDLRASVRFTYPVADPERRAFTYQLTLIGADGSMRALDPVTTADKLVIQPLS